MGWSDRVFLACWILGLTVVGAIWRASRGRGLGRRNDSSDGGWLWQFDYVVVHDVFIDGEGGRVFGKEEAWASRGSVARLLRRVAGLRCTES